MRLGLVFLAAIVLAVFAVIAGAANSGQLFGVVAIEWFFGSFLAYLVSLVFDFGLNGGTVSRTPARQ